MYSIELVVTVAKTHLMNMLPLALTGWKSNKDGSFDLEKGVGDGG